MTMYKYYAVIEKMKEEGNKVYSYIVDFPDLENVFTDGETLQDAIVQAEDVLALMLTVFEDNGDVIPAPSSVEQLKGKVPEGASLVLIEVDTDEYRKEV